MKKLHILSDSLRLYRCCWNSPKAIVCIRNSFQVSREWLLKLLISFPIKAENGATLTKLVMVYPKYQVFA